MQGLVCVDHCLDTISEVTLIPARAVVPPVDTVEAPEVRPAESGRREETARLLREAQAADGPQRDALREQAIRLNMTVAREIARRYRGRGIADDDLEQVAYLGLVKAVQRFDAEMGHDFLSFAVPTVRGELRKHFRDSGWTIRPPRSVQELQTRITAAEAELYQQLGRSPRPTEIAAFLDVELDLVLDSLAANSCFAPVSLDAPVVGDDVAIADRLGGPDPAFASAEARVALRSLIQGLDARERRILELRFFEGCTQAEIGEKVGVTQMQVSRLLSGILAKMRKRMTSEAA